MHSLRVVEELCGRTSEKGGTPRSRNRRWWTEEVAKAVGGSGMTECIRDRGEQPPTCMARRRRQPGGRWTEHGAVWRKNCMYRTFDEDGSKNIIFKMARDRTEDGRDVKRGAVIKDNNGRLITESNEVFRIWAAYFKLLLNGN